MARTPWVFAGYEWAINPETDSGWVKEHNMAEHSPIEGTRSVLQFAGSKSARRRVTGWIWGILGPTQLTYMRAWRENKTQSTLTDHTGESRDCMLLTFEAEPARSVSELRAGRQTYRYTAEFIEV